MESGQFLNINFFTALFTLANTIALFLVFKHFLYGPVMKMITDRQKEIDDLYSDAERSRSEATALETEYRGKLTAAAETGDRMVKEAVERAHRREEEIIAQATAEADAIRAKAVADIAQEKKKAVTEAKAEISDLALAIAGKVVGRALTDGDQAALVDGFIDSLGDET